jgi:O-antigen/teichoic acid export membrane protein
MLTGLFIFYALIIPLVRGVLQGKKKFMALGYNLVLESVIKFVAGLILVLMGLKVWGAIGAFIAGSSFAALFVFSSIKEVINSKKERVEYLNLFSSNFSILLGMTAIVLMYSLDVILARKFFTPELAGQYSFVSLIAKTILFSSFAIGKAMFPISSENFENNKETKSIFKKSILITLIVASAALVLFYFLSGFIVKILSLGDTRYLSASPILFILGLGFSFASISYILILYNISTNKMKKSSFGLLFFVLLEIILLILFNSSIHQFSVMLAIVNFLMLLYNIWITKK